MISAGSSLIFRDDLGDSASGLDDEKEDHETLNVNDIQRRKLQEK